MRYKIKHREPGSSLLFLPIAILWALTGADGYHVMQRKNIFHKWEEVKEFKSEDQAKQYIRSLKALGK